MGTYHNILSKKFFYYDYIYSGSVNRGADLGVSKMLNIGGTQEIFTQPSAEYVDKIKTFFENDADMTVEVQGML